jgi:preprotein translocase subunit YajC
MLNLLISSTYAQDAAGAAAQQQPAWMGMAPFVIIFMIFYFLMIRPQKKKLEEEQSMLNSLTKGDEIYTKSGIIGKIVGLTDKIVTLEVSDGMKFKILRSSIAGPSSTLFKKQEEK